MLMTIRKKIQINFILTRKKLEVKGKTNSITGKNDALLTDLLYIYIFFFLIFVVLLN